MSLGGAISGYMLDLADAIKIAKKEKFGILHKEDIRWQIPKLRKSLDILEKGLEERK